MDQTPHDHKTPASTATDPLPSVNALLAQQAKRAKRQLILGFLGIIAFVGTFHTYQRQSVLGHAHPYDRAILQIAVNLSAPDLCATIEKTANIFMPEFSSGTRAHLLQADCYYLTAIKSGNPSLCPMITKPLITIGLPITLLADAKECARTLSNPQLMNEENASLNLDTIIPSQLFMDVGYTPELLRHFFSGIDETTRNRYHVDLNNPDTLTQSYFFYLQDSNDQNAREGFLQQVRGIRK